MNATAAQTKSLEWLNRLRANPKIPLIVAGSAAVAVMVALILWAKAPDYRTLFSNLSDQDGGAIVSQLTQMNIPYRFSEASGAIEVPADKVHELRLRLAQQGLPKGGAVGFELLDQEKFGISQFSEQVNYQRALEGELSRTIETIGPVKGARVHLAMPKPSLFVREQKSPSASVTVNLLPGRALDEGQISAIVHLVSSAVAGLPPGNVTLVDQGGHLLAEAQSKAEVISTPSPVTAAASPLITPHQTQPLPTVAAPVLSAPLGSHEWQQSLSQHISLFTRQGQQSAELRLHPQDLGEVQISLKVDDNQAQIQMVSPHQHVRAALEAALPVLRTQLAESGIQLGQSNISGESFSGQQQAASQQQQSQRTANHEPLAGEDDDTLLVPVSLQVRVTGNSGVDIFA
ncbi:flagellar M-ring protein FliF [Escherichia coli]|nr:flagellar M-ring protein FliF [Escherichia coli]